MTYKTYRDLVSEAKTRIREISPPDSIALHASDPKTVFIDIREPNEWNLGYIPRAVHMERGNLESKIEAVPREQRIVLYCASGNRTALAADTLQQMGYSNVESMAGGFRGWVEAGGDVEG